MRHRLLRLLPRVALLAPPLLPATAAAQRGDPASYRSWIDTSFAFGRGGLVDLGQVSGAVVVETWDRDEVRIRAYAQHGRIESSLASNRVWLRLQADEQGPRRDRIGDSRYELTIPSRARLKASSVSGSVRVTGVRGDVDVSTTSGTVSVVDGGGLTTVGTVSGTVRVTRLEGDLVAKTVSGAVDVRDVRGDVRAGTTSGAITLRGVSGRTVSARSTSGSVTFEGDFERNGRYEFHSHSGTVTLALADGVGAEMSLRTFSGSVNTDFPITLGGGARRTTSTRSLEFTLGGGGGRVSVETFSGNVLLRRAGGTTRGRG